MNERLAEMNKKLAALLGLEAGLVIGLTWPRSKKYVYFLLNGARAGVGSACGWLVGFGTAQTKRLGDRGSKAGRKKKKKPATTAAKTKRRRAPLDKQIAGTNAEEHASA